MHGKIDQMGYIKGVLNPRKQIIGKIIFPDVIPPDIYDGETTIIPACYYDQELETKNKMLLTDVIVKKIPYYETHNEKGLTIYIGNEDLIVFGGGN